MLSNATGNDITLSDTAVANAGTTTLQAVQADGSTAVGSSRVLAADTTVDTSIVVGQITFDSAKTFSVAQAAGGTNLLGAAGAGATGSTLNKVSDLDVSTVTKSNEAIKTIDSALAMIDSERSNYGAMQNRLTSTISNLATTSENLSASRSRIQDTDFAAETANMTKAVDGVVLGESSPTPLVVKCGKRNVRVGSQGTGQTVDVPCGGEALVR